MSSPRCSTAARRRGEPMLGTAAPARRWLLLEHPGGWAPAALDSGGIDDAAATELHRTALATGSRVVLVRRPGRTDREVPRRWGVVDHDGRSQWGTWTRSEDLAAAAAVLREGPAGEDRGGAATPLLLVCTHGRHDVCCAVRGRPVAAALALRWPERVWECSHIGGDRFAANLLVVPDGTVYGGLDPATAVGVLERHLAGRVDATHLRGFSTQPPPVQAALVAVLRDLGPAAVSDVSPVDATQNGPHEWRVEVAGTGSLPARTVVDVRRTVTPPAKLTCRGPQDATAYTYAATVGTVA